MQISLETTDTESRTQFYSYMAYGKLIADVEKYVVDMFEKNSSQVLAYHNLEHTRRVVFRCGEISDYYHLNEQDLFIVHCAAWFHDVGYLTAPESLGHEQRGADLVAAFLEKHFISLQIITKVQGCIMATILPQNPITYLQEMVCDADLYHFGTGDLFSQDALMHKEVELRIGKEIDIKKWTEETIRLLKSHNYHTEYCRQLLNHNKDLNLIELGMI